VAALGLEHAGRAVVGGRGLRLADGGRRLEGDGEEDVGAVGDAALDAAGVVGGGGERGGRAGGRGDERVVVRAACHAAPAEAAADLEAFRRWDRQHRVRQHRFQLVEAWLA